MIDEGIYTISQALALAEHEKVDQTFVMMGGRCNSTHTGAH